MKKHLRKITGITFCILSFTNARSQNITTAVGNGFPGYTGDGGTATMGQLSNPFGVTFNKGDTMYIADQANSAIRMVVPTGTITTVAGDGTGVLGYSGDGGQATVAKLNNPNAIVIDKAGNLIIADAQNARIRKVTPAGVINTIAGTGTAGYSGDGAAATLAKISNNVSSITCDTSGNIYFADRGNHRIRKINAAGIISTFAGTGTAGYSGDGGAATSAKLSQPFGITFRSADTSFYIADYGNHVVRRVNKAGIINTIVGTGTSGSTGDGGAATAATMNGPACIVFDAQGQMYISDFSASVVRLVDVSKNISTAVGTGFAGFGGDNGLATAAFINKPAGMAMNSAGNLYIADYVNNRIRKVKYNTVNIAPATETNLQVTVFPNPSTGIFNLFVTNTNEKLTAEIYSITGQKVATQILEHDAARINISNLSSGAYELRLLNEGHATIYQSKIIKQ